ncbi:MAG: histidine kinase [Cytophagales bacterium]|nr:histidine kinase [Cytophagales bacterium]
MAATVSYLETISSKNRWVVHVAFWAFVLVLYSLLFAQGSNQFWHTVLFVGLLMPVTISATYLLNYFLVPTYLLRGRYASFALYFLYTLVGALFLIMWIVVLTFIVVAELNIKAMSPGSINLTFLLTSLLMIVFLGVALKMVSHWQKSKRDYNQLMRDKIEAELKFLKVQLNPHFLFNTLNNLYYLSIEKSDQTPKAILALSEMLDYVLHEGRSQLVSVLREVTQLRNYIELEKLRYGNRLVVELTTNGNLESVTVPPMMLITLVENSFKHGAMPTADNSWIKISISNSNFLRIEIRNSWKKIMMGEGIGLANIKSQLEILFPQKHSLEIDTSQANEFGVVLIIKE